MPPLAIGGFSFLVGADDLVFLAPMAVGLNLAWAVADMMRAVRVGAWRMEVPVMILDADAVMCLVMALLDSTIGILSCQGAIMQPRRHPTMLKCFVVLRYVLLLAVALNFLALVAFVGKDLKKTPRPPLSGAPELSAVVGLWGFPGWGPALPASWWPTALLGALLLSRGAHIWFAFFLAAVVSIPKAWRGQLTEGVLARTLNMFGAQDSIVKDITQVLWECYGQHTFDVLVPSDLAFALLLVQAKQMQGMLASDPDEEATSLIRAKGEDLRMEEGMCNSKISKRTARACTKQQAQPFDVKSPESRAALSDILHFQPYAVGIYGFPRDVLAASMCPGTVMLNPARLFYECCRAVPCCQATPKEAKPRCCCCCCCPPKGPVEGDPCCLHEYSLRRVLGDGAEEDRSAAPAVLWATWENHGPGTSPPVAVLLDDERRELVIAVRGTSDIKDVIADIGAVPIFFDPLGQATPGEHREPPFDDERDLFVHKLMLSCAQDAWQRLRQARVLERALGPGGQAEGFRVVVVGHSLGAGVACLLAFHLHSTFSNVQCIAFEPPGGLLSKRLALETQRLGWLSTVCANDFISHLSIRSLQRMRNDALKELAVCNRSKLQLMMLYWASIQRHLPLCCLRRPLSAFFTCLGGGPLDAEGDTELSSKHILPLKLDDRLWANLLPPGRIAYVRPTEEEPFLCGFAQRDTDWTVEWVQPEELTEIIVSTRSLELHMPSVFCDAFERAAANVGVRAGARGR